MSWDGCRRAPLSIAHHIGKHGEDAASSEDAFDAAESAVAMADVAERFKELSVPPDVTSGLTVGSGTRRQRRPAVHFVDPSTGRDRVIGNLERYAPAYDPMGLAVSPDGTSILYNKVVSEGADLMLIENFN
jgi:hypothetical protein